MVTIWFFPIADGKIETIWRRSRSENIHLDAVTVLKEEKEDLRGESDGSPPQDSSRGDGEARNDFGTLRAERRVIPNSITKYWRGQSCKYDLGCDAWAPHWRLLQYRRWPRSISCVDGFHTVHHIGWKSSQTGIHGPESGWESSKQHPGQITSGQKFGKYVRRSSTQRKTKVDCRRTKDW